MTDNRTVKIAIVQGMDGKLSVCGPDDFNDDHPDAMSAAYCWLLEAGHTPADRFWLSVDLPPPSAGAIDVTGRLLTEEEMS